MIHSSCGTIPGDNSTCLSSVHLCEEAGGARRGAQPADEADEMRVAGHAMPRCMVVLAALSLSSGVTPGPGKGPWERGRPEDHGMLSSQSELIATLAVLALPLGAAWHCPPTLAAPC